MQKRNHFNPVTADDYEIANDTAQTPKVVLPTITIMTEEAAAEGK